MTQFGLQWHAEPATSPRGCLSAESERQRWQPPPHPPAHSPSFLPLLFSHPLFLWMNTLGGCRWWFWWLTLPDRGNLINEVASAALARPPPPPPPPHNWSHMPVYSFGDLPPHAATTTPRVSPPHPHTPNFLLLSPSRDANSVQWSGSSKVRDQKKDQQQWPTFFNLFIFNFWWKRLRYRFHFGSVGRRTVGGKRQGRVWVHLPGCSGGGPARGGCSSTASLCTESSWLNWGDGSFFFFLMRLCCFYLTKKKRENMAKKPKQ